MSSIRSEPKTFVAALHPRAAQWNLTPNLSDVTLANVLSGDTCSPISFTDFERHLTFVAHCVENLQFLVWFQDYRYRFLQNTSRTPSPPGFLFNAPNLAETERRALESIAKLEGHSNIEKHLIGTPPASTDDSTSPSTSLSLPPKYTQATGPPSAYTVSEVDTPETQLFRTECCRTIATFLSPGAAKELLLDVTVRDTVIRNFASNCHPDIFMPVYEEVYSLLERGSLPGFLSAASANINLPKQIYYYCVGALNIVVGIALAISLITKLPIPPRGNRAWRLISVAFLALGAAQCYSAWRGYCSQVWMRGNTQIRVWEMDEMDEEARSFVDRILGPYLAKGPKRDSTDTAHSRQGPDPSPVTPLSTKDLAKIAPFTVEPSRFHDTTSPYILPLSPTNDFQRPPVFGPEAVVQDPRIKAVHRQLMGDVVRFGLWTLLVFSAIFLAVPGREHV